MATHIVDIFLPEGVHETWQLCRTHDRELKLQVVRGRPKAPTPPGTSVTTAMHCGECQQLLDEPSSLPVEERQACPNCGSLMRHGKITIVETLTFHESFGIKSSQPGKGRWIRNFKSGDDYSRYLEGWGERVLDVDQQQNTYREVIRLYDGTVIESTARLSDHHD